MNVLDNFDAICSDLKIGLPAEIEARKKQYEYYRDLLLSFKPIGTVLAQASKQASKQAFIKNKGLLLPERIVSGSFPFFQAVHNIQNRMLVYREILFPDLSPIKASFCLDRLFVFI